MQDKDTAIFDISVGMDQDTYPGEVSRGSWFHALNVLFHSGLQGKNKVASNAIGNTEIVNEDLLNLSWKPFAEAVDSETKNSYFFLKHPASNTYQLWQLDNDGTYTLVLSSIHLNLLSDDQVKGFNIVDGKAYWIDPFFESFLEAANGQFLYGNPKMLIIDKAIRFTQSGGTDPLGYPSIDFQTLSALKFPPVYSPEGAYASDINFRQNFHWRKTYQFMYRYVYDDKSRSLFSSFSELVCILDNERMDGKNVFDVTVNNKIVLSINSGHHTATDIEIAVRDGNSGNWGVFKKINKLQEAIPNDTIITVDFFGNESQETVSDIDLYNYDLLPYNAGEQQYTTANTIVYGAIREGLQNPEQDISAKWIHYKVDKAQFSYGVAETFNVGADPLDPIFPGFSYCAIEFPLSVVNLPVGSVIIFRCGKLLDCDSIDGGYTAVFFAYTIQEGDFVGATDLDKLTNMLNNMEVYFESVYDIEVSTPFSLRTIAIKCHRVLNLPDYSVPILKRKTFKQGCDHIPCIIYKKEGQQDGQVVSDAYKIYLPYGFEDRPSGYTIQDFYYTLMKLSVSHIPPEWATTWVPGLMERSGMGAQMQRTIMGGGVIGQRVRFDLEVYYEDAYSVGYDYTIEKGDSVRLVQKPNKVDGVSEWYDSAVNIQLSVLEFSPGGGTSGSDAVFVELFDLNGLDLRGCLLEFSKIKKSSDTYPFFEVGQEYPIIDAHTPERRHGGGDIYSGLVSVGGGVGQFFFEFEGNYELYVGEEGRTIVLTNNFDQTQSVTLVSYADFTSTVRFIVTPALLFDFTESNGGRWTMSADQSGAFPAQVLLNGIDTYLRTKTMGTYLTSYPTGTFVIEDDSLSNFYPSQDYDRGRVHLYNPESGQRDRFNLIRGSLPYSEGTEVNQLNRFIPGEEALGPFDHGKIVGMYMRGETLRVLQERKVFSIPIKRQVGVLPGQGTQYLFSDAQLGPQDAGSPKQGALRAEASIQIESDIYYLDVFNKTLIKDTLGGSFPINGKLNQFWRTICEAIIPVRNAVSVRMGYAHATKELLISVWMRGNKPVSSLNFTIGLDVRTDKWTSFYSFIPDMYVHGFERMYMVRRDQGTLWEHATGAANTFFGTEYRSQLYINTNGGRGAEQDKRFLSMFLATNQEPFFVEVVSDPTLVQPNGLDTYVALERRNDGYFGTLNMNRLTPGFSNPEAAMAEGFPMQAPWFRVQIDTPAGEEFVMRFADFYFNFAHELK